MDSLTNSVDKSIQTGTEARSLMLIFKHNNTNRGMKRFIVFLVLAIAPFTFIKAQFSISGHQATCYDSCNGSAQVQVPAGTYRYLWNTGDTVSTVSNLCSGPYQCIISDSLGNVLDTLSISVRQPLPLVLTPAILKNNPCYGDTAGYVIFNATGGTGNRYNFTWSTGYQGFLSNNDKFNLTAGNYTVTITDINGCSASTAFALMQPAPVTVSPQITNTTTCSACNGSITISATGGASSSYRYSWSNGATVMSVSNLCPGGYNLSVTDTSGCMVIANLNVFSNQGSLNVSFSSATNIDCSHRTGFLFASPAGGTAPYHYQWTTGSTTPDIFNLQAGIYHVSVTDSLGCFAVAGDTIKNLGIVITTLLQQDFRCDINSGKIEIALSQGNPPYILQWSNAANTTALNGLRPGTYTVTVTDQANCSAMKTYTVAQINNALSAQTTGNNVTCLNINNGSAFVTLTGGLPPFNYLWNTTPYQTTDTAVNMPAGNYQVRVIDAFGCSVFAGVNILSNYNNQVSTTTVIGNCDSTGSATATISAGTPPYTYLWNTQPAQTTATADNLKAGNYNVSVTDSTGCIRTGLARVQYSCIGLVTGTIFYDVNANCIIDHGEQGVGGVPVFVTNSHITFEGTTNLSGDYSIPVTATGGYKIIIGVGSSSAILQYANSACGYLEACPASDTITFLSLNDTFQNYNFGFVGSSDFDLAINAGWSPVNANHTKEYWALYANEAYITPYTNTAIISFKYDSNLIFQSGIPAPMHNASTHTLTWTVDSIPSPTFVWANRVRAFFTVPIDLPATYQLKSTFHIEPISGDCDTANNWVFTEEIAGLPVVPISKEVNPPGNLIPDDTVLTYTIHFQNTGADSVHVLRITDSLSPHLDPMSVQNIAASPLYNQFYLAPGAVLNWVFNPANLPGSNVNSLASAGFVSFTAKLKPGAQPGSTIKNHATVFMDNNTPIFTDTTVNFIAYPAAVTELSENQISVHIFPNPFKNNAQAVVDGPNNTYGFVIMDITGRVVQTITSVTSNQFILNRESLPDGVYIYRLYNNNGVVAYGKIVIE